MNGLFTTKGNGMKKKLELGVRALAAGSTVLALVSCAPQNKNADDSKEEDLSALLESTTIRTTVIDFGDEIKMEFVQLQAGSFQMGSANGLPAEKPVHTVELTQSFWMAKTEVTQAQYKKLMDETPSELDEKSFHPADGVNWKDAVAYCEKLTRLARAADSLPEGYVYALPTEAQWEYACRAGTDGDYAGDVEAMAWHKGNSEQQTHPVAQKEANAWGLHDMHGNVWEWCQDVFDREFYTKEAATASDPVNVERGPYRTLRGGAWLFNTSQCRSSFRFGDSPGSGFSYIGFRVCLVEGPEEKPASTVTQE